MKTKASYILARDRDGQIGTHYFRAVTSWAVHCVMNRAEAVRMDYRKARHLRKGLGAGWRVEKIVKGGA